MPVAPAKPELLSLREVVTVLGIGLRSLNRIVERGLFPRPIRLSSRTLRYSRRAVLQWIDERSERLR
jgi:predicted DNA-binding transcriptional regulator AlpA